MPNPRTQVRFIEKNNNIITRKVKQYILQKVNLSQLPEYLWINLEKNNLNEHYKYKPIIDKVIKYNIIDTPVDVDILELKSILDNSLNNNSTRIIELLQILQDNNINGWLIIKAKKKIGDTIQRL